MTTPNIYPIVQTPRDMGTWSRDPDLARMIWTRLRAEDAEIREVVWFALGITIVNFEKVVIHVYDMADTVFGGIGEEVFSTEVDKFTYNEQQCIEFIVSARKTELATEEFERRRTQARSDEIFRIRQEMFG